MGALGSAVWLKTNFLTRVKCASNMSARYFDSMVFVCCLCFNHLESTLIPPEKGETTTGMAEIYAVYIMALHPTVRSQLCAPGAEFGSKHHGVRGDQPQPLHSQEPHFFLSQRLTWICEKHKYEENNPEQTIRGRCHQGFWKCYHSTPRSASLVQSLFPQHSRSKSQEIV